MVGYLDVLKNTTFSSINIFFVEVINYFCGMVDGCKAFSLISSRDHCQRASSLQIFDMRCAGLESVQNLSSGFVEWICVAGITTTSQPHKEYKRKYFLSLWSCPYTEYNLLEIPVKQPKKKIVQVPHMGHSALLGQYPMKSLSSVRLSVTKFSHNLIFSFFWYCTWW